LIDRKYVWLPEFHQNEYYLYVLFRTAALYTHYFSFIIFIAEIIFAVIVLRPGVVGRIKPAGESEIKNFTARLTPFTISFFTVILLYIPWFPTFIEHITRGQSWRNSQTIYMAIHEVVNYIKDLNMGLYYHYTDLRLVYYLTIFLCFVYGITLLIILYNLFKKEQSGKAIIPAVIVLVPIIIGVIISLKQKVEFYRYLSIIIPFAIMFVLYALSLLKKNIIIIPALATLMLINIFGITSEYSFKFKNDDYRPLINYIEGNFKAGDRIYVEPHYMGWSIAYYKKQWDLNLPNPVYIRYGWNEILDSLNTQKPNKFWIILDYSAVDTTKYADYIKGLKKNNKFEERMTYYLAPSKVELYRFEK